MTNTLWGILHIFHIHHWEKWGREKTKPAIGFIDAIGGSQLLYQYRNCKYCNMQQERII